MVVVVVAVVVVGGGAAAAAVASWGPEPRNMTKSPTAPLARQRGTACSGWFPGGFSLRTQAAEGFKAQLEVARACLSRKGGVLRAMWSIEPSVARRVGLCKAFLHVQPDSSNDLDVSIPLIG